MKNETEELVTREKPIVDTKVEKLKIKSKKPKKLTKKADVLKVDLSKKEETKTEEDAIQGETVTSVQDKGETSEESREDSKMEVSHEDENKKEEKVNVIEEITDEEIKIGETVVEKPVAPVKSESPKINLPENIEKLVNFMAETGGDINDYVRLNFDYTSVSDDVLLKEYYKATKPHLNREEVEFIIEDQFSIDEENDTDRGIKKKKLAYKEEVAKATSFLEETKNKYYDEIKLKPSITGKSKQAVEFYDKYNKDQEVSLKKHEEFNITKNYFNQDFKGFEFKLGEKKFRYGINNPNELADTQSDIGNFVKMFLHEDGTIKDHKGYHKAIYAAKNADTIAQHFYEQGKADAVKNVMAKSKNINNTPRASGDGNVFINGLKVKAVTGLDTTKLKVKKINL
jgi:hypothetical protein